jgi:hypothetical protein
MKEYWDFLIEHEVATEQELQLVTCLMGYKYETLDDILYCRTGYRDKAEFERQFYN